MALLNDNNYYIAKCNTVQIDIPTSGFLETDNKGLIVASQYNKFSVFPKTWSIFANQLIDLPVNLTYDVEQFFGFYTEPEDTNQTYTTQVELNITSGFYNLYVLCFCPQGSAGSIALTIGSKVFIILVTGQPVGNNIIRASDAIEIDTPGQYFGSLNVSKRLGVTQIWLSPYNAPLPLNSQNQSSVQSIEAINEINPFDTSQPIKYIYLPSYQN
jgi:hypothetical protein